MNFRLSINTVKFLLIIVWVWMVFVVINTSLQSNLFTEWHFLASIPWMRATLWDFYGNVLVIYIWLCYKEQNIFRCAVWAVLFFTLGSIASIAYLIIQLHKHSPTNHWDKVFLRQ